MAESPPGTDDVMVLIDGSPFRVGKGPFSGSAIRQMPYPPVPEDRDLWLEVPMAADRLVRDDDMVDVTEETRFFTSPRSIMAGDHDSCHTPSAY